jgi:hypothetical protein
MQQQFNVDLPSLFTIPENKESLARVLEILFDPEETPLSALISAIQYENKPKFGPSAISNLRYDVVQYDSITLRGRIRVGYDMQLTFGCEDAIKDHLNQHSYYNFRFIAGQSLLHVESDAPEAASTFDEF